MFIIRISFALRKGYMISAHTVPSSYVLKSPFLAELDILIIITNFNNTNYSRSVSIQPYLCIFAMPCFTVSV